MRNRFFSLLISITIVISAITDSVADAPDKQTNEEVRKYLREECLEAFLGPYRIAGNDGGVFAYVVYGEKFACAYSNGTTDPLEGQAGANILARREALAIRRCNVNKFEKEIMAPCRVFARDFRVVWRKTLIGGLDVSPNEWRVSSQPSVASSKFYDLLRELEERLPKTNEDGEVTSLEDGCEGFLKEGRPIPYRICRESRQMDAIQSNPKLRNAIRLPKHLIGQWKPNGLLSLLAEADKVEFVFQEISAKNVRGLMYASNSSCGKNSNHPVAGTYDGQTLSLMVDGRVEGCSSSKIVLGKLENNSFEGSIDGPSTSGRFVLMQQGYEWIFDRSEEAEKERRDPAERKLAAERNRREAEEQSRLEATRVAEQQRKAREEAARGPQWAESDNGSNINWAEAKRYCEIKGSGWRLPTVDELQANYQSGHSTSCGAFTCQVAQKFRLTGPFFWTNETNSSSNAWGVYLSDGTRNSANVMWQQAWRALCVRRP